MPSLVELLGRRPGGAFLQNMFNNPPHHPPSGIMAGGYLLGTPVTSASVVRSMAARICSFSAMAGSASPVGLSVFNSCVKMSSNHEMLISGGFDSLAWVTRQICSAVVHAAKGKGVQRK